VTSPSLKRRKQRPEQVGGDDVAVLLELIADPATGTYPASGATVYPARRLANPSFDLVSGKQSLTFVADTRTVYAWSDAAVYFKENTVVLAEWVNNRYWIRGVIRAAP